MSYLGDILPWSRCLHSSEFLVGLKLYGDAQAETAQGSSGADAELDVIHQICKDICVFIKILN